MQFKKGVKYESKEIPYCRYYYFSLFFVFKYYPFLTVEFPQPAYDSRLGEFRLSMKSDL